MAKPEQLAVDQSGNWQYPSGARTGHVQIELPALPGSLTPTETLLARDFGTHVIGKIEASMQRGYLKSGPQQSPPEVLAHYAAVAEGASLMSPAALGRMKELAQEFEMEPEKREYLDMVVKPYLYSLKPAKR
jgi:hypothetical protein